MSFRRLLDRSVTIVPRIVTGQDARGNDVVADGVPIPDVPAGRELERTDEDLEARDQVDERFVYFLPAAKDDGTAVAISNYDRILDGDEIYHVDGVDAVVRRRTRRLHHYEVTAYRIEG